MTFYLTRASKVAYHAEVVKALEAVVDVLVRCDGEKMPSDLEPCTDEEWDTALERAQAVLAKGDAGKHRVRAKLP